MIERWPHLKDKVWIYVGNWGFSGKDFRFALVETSEVLGCNDTVPFSAIDPVVQVCCTRYTVNNKDVMISDPVFGHLVYWGWCRGKE